MKELVKRKAADPIDEKDNTMGLTEKEQLCHDKLMECMDLFMKTVSTTEI